MRRSNTCRTSAVALLLALAFIAGCKSAGQVSYSAKILASQSLDTATNLRQASAIKAEPYAAFVGFVKDTRKKIVDLDAAIASGEQRQVIRVYVDALAEAVRVMLEKLDVLKGEKQ